MDVLIELPETDLLSVIIQICAGISQSAAS